MQPPREGEGEFNISFGRTGTAAQFRPVATAGPLSRSIVRCSGKSGCATALAQHLWIELERQPSPHLFVTCKPLWKRSWRSVGTAATNGGFGRLGKSVSLRLATLQMCIQAHEATVFHYSQLQLASPRRFVEMSFLFSLRVSTQPKCFDRSKSVDFGEGEGELQWCKTGEALMWHGALPSRSGRTSCCTVCGLASPRIMRNCLPLPGPPQVSE